MDLFYSIEKGYAMKELLVRQLHFARQEFQRVFEGVTPADATRRLLPSNCLSWVVGHLAVQEQWYWITLPTGRVPVPELNTLTAPGQPPSTPDYEAMWTAWRQITAEADKYLISLQESDLSSHHIKDGRPISESIGTMLQRNIFHYWFHLGEVHSLRQQMGHTDLPNFVGRTGTIAITQEGWDSL